jgi:hypothetical protein
MLKKTLNTITKIIIIFICGLISRLFVNNYFDINIFIDVFNYISILYYLFFSFFVVFVRDYINIYNFSMPNFFKIFKNSFDFNKINCDSKGKIKANSIKDNAINLSSDNLGFKERRVGNYIQG